MAILGISCHYHDSAACIVRDGKVLAAAEEERFTRVKHDSGFPKQAVNFCVQKAGILFPDITHVAFYEKPYLKFARSLIDHVEEHPRSLRHFLRTMPHWLGERLVLPDFVEEEMAIGAKMYFVPHHYSHAAFSYLLSGFREASLLTLDGVGEWATGTRGVARGSAITLEEEIRYPDSAGLFYGTIAEHLGFSALGGEGKLMGLAAYGKPTFMKEMERLLEVDDGGGFRMGKGFYAFRRGESMGSPKLTELLGPARSSGGEITGRHQDIAASAQAHLERVILQNARVLRARHGTENLCLGGGVALNCLANGKVRAETGFRNVFVPPGCGDSGGAIGAALYLESLLGKSAPEAATSAYWGPSFSAREIEREARTSGLAWEKLDGEEALLSAAASSLRAGKVIGWFHGPMEFGPRALGNRSILALPGLAATRDRVNELKRREKFRPFAPMVPAERAAEYFELEGESPFMLFAVKVREAHRASLGAVTHVDGSARVQTVRAADNPLVHALLLRIGASGLPPVLLNTSFNLDDEPIVCAPGDAFRTFARSGLDELFIGPYRAARKG